MSFLMCKLIHIVITLKDPYYPPICIVVGLLHHICYRIQGLNKVVLLLATSRVENRSGRPTGVYDLDRLRSTLAWSV